MAALTDALRDPDERVAGLAAQALEDLERVALAKEEAAYAAEQAASPSSSPALPNAVAQAARVESGDGSENARNHARAQEPQAPPTPSVNWNRLSAQALQSREAEKRGEALHQVGNLRQPEAVNILIQAAQDESDGNRYIALRQLWVSAADGMDGGGMALDTLRSATKDENPRIAQMAASAVADLERMEEARRNPPPPQEPAPEELRAREEHIRQMENPSGR